MDIPAKRRESLRRIIEHLTELYDSNADIRYATKSMHSSTYGDEYGDTAFENITIVYDR